MLRLNRLAFFAWGVLAFNIVVILWGALVRATGSGAGCGNHWPACNGEIIPIASQTETVIEFTHRLTSGLALILVIVLFIWIFRAFPKGHQARLGATLSLGFIIIEALIGAGLVLFELVADDTSIARAVVIAIHLVNTFLLLSWLTLTAWWASGGRPVRWRGQGGLGWGLWATFLGLLLLGASGAITALGDTLYPAASLAEGLRQDLSPTAHFLVRLRLYHPIIALSVGAVMILMNGVVNSTRPAPRTRALSRLITLIYLTQIAAGALNVALLAPIWMQLFHLFLSDIILIIFVLFMANAFAQPQPESEPLASPTTSSENKVFS